MSEHRRRARLGEPAGDRLTSREKDRIWSEYMEMLASRHPAPTRLPGARLAVIGLLGLAAAAVGMAALAPLTAAIGLPMWARWVIIGVFVALIFAGIVTLATGLVGPRRRMWRAALRKCGHDVCVVCGYWLEHRAPGSRICPECGTADDEQPVPLGTRLATREWPRFEPDPPDDTEDGGSPRSA